MTGDYETVLYVCLLGFIVSLVMSSSSIFCQPLYYGQVKRGLAHPRGGGVKGEDFVST